MTDHLNNSPTAPRTEELVATIQGLLATWESAEQSVRLDRDQIGRLASSVSLGMHAHRVAAAVMACYRAGLWVEAIPLARSCYETALRCQWLRAIEDADLSLFAEHDRQAIDLLRSMVDGRWITDSEDISEIARREAERATRSDASGSPSVFQMCMDLREAGHSAYALYRALSSYSHPGVTVVDLHIGRDVDGEWSGCFTQEPQLLGEAQMALWPVCASLVWAGRAIDGFDSSHPRRRQLRTIASSLGIPVHLTISDDAWRRVHRAKSR
jgi:hypothetical protein